MESYELAWAVALAEEHTNERELLATLSGELGAFASECAAALTALDGLVELGALSGLLDVETGSRNAALTSDIDQRLPGLAQGDGRRDEQLSGFYSHLGGEADLSQTVVQQAGKLLRADPQRTDRVLLNAIIDAAGERSVIRRVVGPASVTALYALGPLADWAPSLAGLGTNAEGRRGKLMAAARDDLTTVLQSIATSTEEPIEAHSIPLEDSLRDTVEHVEKAARTVTAMNLEHAIAEARTRLEADLDRLHTIESNADGAPYAWHVARRMEHAALVEEVRDVLAKVEKIRTALGVILPYLQVTVEALAAIEKRRGITGRLDASAAAGLNAARMSLLLAAAEVSEATLPEMRHAVSPPRPVPRRWLVGAAVVLVAAVIAIALSLNGDRKKHAAPSTILNVTPLTTIPPAPKISPLHSTSLPQQRATFYSISVRSTHQGKPVYSWHLTPPKDNQSCNRFGTVFGAPNRAVWHHAAADGCTHAGVQHPGTVTVTVRTRYWQCTASLFGTLTASGDPPRACTRI